MFTITNLENIDNFLYERKVLSIFLATSFEQETAIWLFRNWMELHQETGSAWHLLVPTYVPINNNLSKATFDNYNTELSRMLAQRYGINQKDLPCIVFDDLNEDSHQHYISLKNKDSIQLRDFFYDCAKIINKNQKKLKYYKSSSWRQAVIGEIFNQSQARLYGEKLYKTVKVFGSLVKFAKPLT